GLLGTRPSYEMMRDCDTLFMIGSRFPSAEFLPKEGQARGVQIDLDGKMLSIRYPMEVNLQGDSAATLQALKPLLEPKSDHGWRATIGENTSAWWKLLEERAMVEANPLNPQRVFWELSPRLPERCILSCDSGSAANWYARDIRIRPGMMGSLSGNLATMGPGVPYAIAAKFAFPDRVPVAMVGDGAMQMNGLNGLITISKYWRQWSDPRLVVLVLNNRDLNQVSQVGDAWTTAFSADRPVVVEAFTDPDVPPLPPHITLKEARAFTATLLKGDPDEGGVLKQTAKQVLQELLPHRH
ncbi:MAG: thiamine pyrophosphate-requiring protein, partial [Gammaproteobacteria bacterium]|nr:thiamine pyrophosphate-requiring protein [Gammaproteobacteria bacterium]